ncbi:MAG: class C sortase [Lachnospiraceae bacterium]
MRLKNRIISLLLVVVLLSGISLLLYPFVSDYWNAQHQSKVISLYTEEVAIMDDETYERLWNESEIYNASLLERDDAYTLTELQSSQYDSMLNAGNSDVMGYIEIPSIRVILPIYHGTSDATLQRSVGHLEWTSLPIGGNSTHAVISGHRGLPSASLFTDLDKLIVGDVFMIQVLDETLTYEVDQIKIIEPVDATDLTIVEGEDYVTLMTCTPYGINTHRLLVRGHRVANTEDAANVHLTSEAIQIEPLLVAPIVAIPLLLVLLTVVLNEGDSKKKRRY